MEGQNLIGINLIAIERREIKTDITFILTFCCQGANRVVAGKRRGINNNHFQNDSSTYD
jgi:hypothetical protein